MVARNICRVQFPLPLQSLDLNLWYRKGIIFFPKPWTNRVWLVVLKELDQFQGRGNKECNLFSRILQLLVNVLRKNASIFYFSPRKTGPETSSQWSYGTFSDSRRYRNDPMAMVVSGSWSNLGSWIYICMPSLFGGRNDCYVESESVHNIHILSFFFCKITFG